MLIPATQREILVETFRQHVSTSSGKPIVNRIGTISDYSIAFIHHTNGNQSDITSLAANGSS